MIRRSRAARARVDWCRSCVVLTFGETEPVCGAASVEPVLFGGEREALERQEAGDSEHALREMECLEDGLPLARYVDQEVVRAHIRDEPPAASFGIRNSALSQPRRMSATTCRHVGHQRGHVALG